MSEADQVNPTNEVAPLQESVSPRILDALFTRLNPGNIEQFYQSYQSWTLQQQRVALLSQIATLQHRIMQHTEQMQGLAPSALALASLTQLQAYGVEDVNLLERMLERGEVWLDHTIQLLIRCKQLDVIGSNYTEWCEHALEGAYDWIDSIGEDTDETSATLVGVEQGSIDAKAGSSAQITEELILRKLMSDDDEADETEKVPAVDVSRITRPLSALNELSLDDEYTETQNSIQELEDVFVDKPQLNTEATCEIHPTKEIEAKELNKTVELKIEPTDTQNDFIEDIMVIQPSELLSDPLINDQLASSSLDAESIEIPPGMQANQLSTELSLDAQLTESIPVDHQRGEEAGIKARDTIDLAEEQQIDVPISTEREQVSLGEPIEQERGEEAEIEIEEAIDYPEEQLAEVSVSTEVEQVGLGEPVQQERGEEAEIEIEEAIDLSEEQPTEVSIGTEVEQVSLEEPVQQELSEEAEIEAGEAIGLLKEQPVDVLTSTEVEQVSLEEPVQQELSEEAEIEAGEAIGLLKEQPVDVLTSTEVEQVSLEEPVQQELSEEAEIEAGEAIGLLKEQPVDVLTSTEVEQVSLEEPVQQELSEEAEIEAGEAIGLLEEQPVDVLTSTEVEQVSLGGPVQQELSEEAEIGAGEAIDLAEALQIDVPASAEREQASLAEPARQITEQDLAIAQELTNEPESSLVHDIAVSIDDTANGAEQIVMLEHSSASTQEEKKPQPEVLLSKRGFLRRLLARIWRR